MIGRFGRSLKLVAAVLAVSVVSTVSWSMPVSAHLPGQPSFLLVDGNFVDYYAVKQPSTSFIDIPQSNAINRFLPGQEIPFEIDRKLLAVSVNDAADMRFEWDFGDGAKAQGVSTTHTYAKAGSYTLKIYGTAHDTRQLVESTAIFVLPDSEFQRPKVFVSVNGKEVSNDTEALDIPAGQEVTLSARLIPEMFSADRFRWDFGDGTTATGQTVKHTYQDTYASAFAVVRADVLQGTYYADNSAQLVNPAGPRTDGPAEWYASMKQAMESGLREVFGGGRTNYALAALILLFAVIAGAFHSLTPGHGKTVLAALLIGQKHNQYRDLLVLTVAITLSHTLVIYVVGLTLIGLNASQSANSLIPYFEKASAALVFVLALYLLSTGLRKWAADRRHTAHHEAGREHSHEHGHSHDHHHHHHSPAFIRNLSQKSHTWSLIIAGTGGGIVPCIDALSLMLLAAGLGHPGFGLVLVIFFSLGLALTISLLGLLLLTGKKRFLPTDRHEKLISIGAPIASGVFIMVLAILLLV